MQGDHPSTPGHDLDPDDRRTSRRTLQRGRKTPDAADQKTNQGRGKDVPPPLRRLADNLKTGHFMNGEISYSMKELRVLAERWRVRYNTVRPHSSLGYKPPAPAAWLTEAPQGYG